MKITIRITDPQGTTTEHVATGLKAARKKAHFLMGRHPKLGRFEAISMASDRLTVSGCSVSELFPPKAADPEPPAGALLDHPNFRMF
jgi:hypothetical protein